MNNSIYLVESNQFYKIGITSSKVATRIGSIQTSSPTKVSLIHSVTNMSTEQSLAYELKLHTHFKHCRMSGEWFELTEAQVSECISLMNLIEPIKSSKKLENSKQKQIEELDLDITLPALEALGKLTIWILPQLQGNHLSVYLAIARRTVGYRQYTSELTSYAQLAELTGVSIPTIKRVMPDLIQSGFIIKVATNQVAHVGKLPYRYFLNMQLPGFPNLGTLRSNRTEVLPKRNIAQLLPLPPVSDYIIHSKQITLLANLDAAKRKLLSDRGQLVHPTEEQLLSYLNSKELLYASKTISNTDS